MVKSCHFLCRKTRHVLKVLFVMRGLRCDGLPLKVLSLLVAIRIHSSLGILK